MRMEMRKFRVAVFTMGGMMMAAMAGGQGFGVSGGVGRTDGTGGGSSVEFGPPKRTEPEKVRIELTVVGKEREWTNTEGRKILASLVAFPKEPAGSKNAPLEVMRDGKVRLLRGEDYMNVAEYPLEKLSEADREFVSNLALNIRLAADAEREKAEAAAAEAGGE